MFALSSLPRTYCPTVNSVGFEGVKGVKFAGDVLCLFELLVADHVAFSCISLAVMVGIHP